MAVNTTHLSKNLLSNQSIWRDTQEAKVEADAQLLETGGTQTRAGVGRILRSLGKGVKTGLMAHGLAMTSSKM